MLQNTRQAGLECIYLFIKLIDNAFCPLQMQVLALCRPIDVSQFDAHLTNQQTVVLVGPVNSDIVVHLGDRKREKGCIHRASSDLGYYKIYLAV